jgi:hypothetical protein
MAETYHIYVPYKASICTTSLADTSELYFNNSLLLIISTQYSVSFLTWNPPRKYTAAAATEQPGNELVTTRTIPSAC